MKSIRLQLVLLFLLAAFGIEAAVYGVRGEVADSTGTPEIYATVRIYSVKDSVKDSVKPVALGVTDDAGKFSQPLPSAGDYRLTVTAVGKRALDIPFAVTTAAPTADLGKLTIRDNANELGEVEIVAQRPLVSREIDRIGYDVKADPESQTNTLQEMLRKVPMVTVESDGTIKVKGSTNFKIYKNGRPNNSFTKNAKDIFAAIPASSIKKIEVITDPGAREDAEGVGAILNIVTDSETSMNGVTGTAGLYIDTNNAEPLPNLYLTSQIDKVTFSVYGGEGYSNRKESEYTQHNVTEYFDSGNTILTETSGYQTSRSGWGGIEASWEPDTLNLFTIEGQGWIWSMGKNNERIGTTAMTGPTGAAVYSFTSHATTPRSRYIDFDGSVNYQRSTRRKGETITASYRLSTTHQAQDDNTEYLDLFECPFPYSAINSTTDLNFIEHTGQLDWSRPYGKIHTLDLGAKGIFRRNHSTSDYDYVGVGPTSDDFTHHTTVTALYADYRVKLGKLSLRGGLRYEYSYLSAKFLRQGGEHPDFSSKLNDWVPSVGMSFNLTDATAFKLSFNRNIRRPGISYLDPTRSVSPTAVSFGNPDLESEVYNNVTLNFSHFSNKINLDASVSTSIVNNGLTRRQWVEDDIMFSTYGNIGKIRSMSASLYAQWSPTSKTSVVASFSLGYNYIKNPDMKNTGWWWNPFARITQHLPWKLDLTGSAYWWSGNPNSAYTTQRPSGASGIGHNISLTKKLLKDDRLTITLSAGNPFGPSRMRFRTVTDTPSSHADYLYIGSNTRRVFGLRLSYRFGSLNASVKKTAASISNDDLPGRKK